MTIWVLGDQLTRRVGPLSRRENEEVLMIEAHGFAERHPYHPHKLTAVFSAMREFRKELVNTGRIVSYYRTDSFSEGLERYFADTGSVDELVMMKPPSRGAADRLSRLVDKHGGSLEILENELFLCSESEFDDWASGSPPYRHEAFYRFMRKRLDIS